MAAYKGHPAWLGKAMQAGGAIATSPPSEDKPIQQAGVLDSVARGAARLLGRTKPAAKAIEDTGGATGQRMRDLMAKGKSFDEAHREIHPEGYKIGADNMEKMKRAVETNKAAEAAGKPYPSDEWKALFPEKKRGGSIRPKARKG